MTREAEAGLRVGEDRVDRGRPTSRRLGGPTGRGTLGDRRLPIGAEVVPGGVHLRGWASRRRRVEALFEGRPPVELQTEPGGYFSGLVPDAGAGARYRLRLDGDLVVPDPASRWQPEGPHGPSVVVDPTTYAWRDDAWSGSKLEGQVIQELHVGTFTREGTWAAAQRALPELAELGVTLLEVMPIAEFPGRFGWGYDGVDLFAPTRLYGQPDDVRRFVDAAHELGLGVLLDVVYNHLGPDGNYLGELGDYFRHCDDATEWGDALAFDGHPAVRELFVANAVHWIEEYHFDGLRLDATQAIVDRSPRHVLAELATATRAAAGDRSIVLVAENEPQDVIHLRPIDEGGFGHDGLWNDDFHHAALVAATGRAEAYCSDYRGSAQELLSAVKWGFLYQGQRYAWQDQPRGTPALDLARSRFVAFLQNHDQVANGARGARGHELTSPGRWRALTALLLLAPHTPMLFQGQEWAASSPFTYFADHEPELAAKVAAGRREFLAQFPSLHDPAARDLPPDPGDPATFERCKLDRSERLRRPGVVALHRDLLRLRATLPRGRLDGAVLGPEAFVLRFLGEGANHRLLLVNLGPELAYDPAPEPLLAPPQGAGWTIVWSSEDPAYGGSGTPPHDDDAGWRLQAHAAALLEPAPRERRRSWRTPGSCGASPPVRRCGGCAGGRASPRSRPTCSSSSGSSPTASAATPRGPWPACRPAATTACWSRPSARRWAGPSCSTTSRRRSGSPTGRRSAWAVRSGSTRSTSTRGTSSSSGSRPACRCGRTTWAAATSSRSRCSCSTARTRRTSPYRLAAGHGPVRLKLYPGTDVRPHEAPLSAELARPYKLTSMQDRFELDAGGAEPPLRLRIHGQHTVFTVAWRTVTQLQHRTEAARGYGSVGALCRPGHFRATLTRDHAATLVASTEPWEVVLALSPAEALEAERTRRARLIAQAHPAAHAGPAAELVLAADAFLVTPSWRIEDTLRAQASGTTARSIIAGYHWFTDWGRDTMISLEGLCLSTGRHEEAKQVLLTFARYVKDGLLPNLFPEGANDGLYNTADATLWFFHALDRYLDVSGDDSILPVLVPALRDIVGHHLHGTRFGIGVDPADGLLRQHADGLALTWMDAKMGDWVVTPRRGKAVEINALWFNALRLLAGWISAMDGPGHARWLEEAAERCRRSFAARFWRDELGHLLDVVDGPDGDDAACRPNQLLALALRHPVLEERRWERVLDVVTRRLLTPVGLRSLAPGHADYKPRYFGDLRARDAAYHQGTVWAWLIGPFIDAWLRVHPEDRAGARRRLEGLVAHLDQACVGSISEVFDAEGSYTPRGCIAQAWSVAEALRAWVKSADPIEP